MSYRVKSVSVAKNRRLTIVFLNGVEKQYDIQMLADTYPQFAQLVKDEKLLQDVRVDVGGYGISWNDMLDIDAEELWDNGETTGRVYPLTIQESIGIKLSQAREACGMTQKDLAYQTKIAQADISKIENGKANPSLNTLKRLADGMHMGLKIEFD